MSDLEQTNLEHVNPQRTELEIALEKARLELDLKRAELEQADYLKKTREELGSIAEHIIRASAIAALSGVLGKMAFTLWPQAPKLFSIRSPNEAYEYFSALSLAISSPILAFFSGFMMISLILHIETLINVKRRKLVFWLFFPVCLLALFSIIGAAISLLSTIK